MTVLPDTQLFLRPGISELSWGHPDPALLPVADLARAADLALRQAGPVALAYGAEQGPGRLLEPLAEWLSRRENNPIKPEQLFITGGVSQGLDLLCTLLTRPGDTVLVQEPVYHLALRIFADHGLRLIGVASDEDGLCTEAVAVALDRLAAEGRRASFLYTVPTWCNPTGLSLSEARRRALAALAEQHGLLILEDDVYRELWYDAPSPAALQSLAPAMVIRLGSFSKILAPGLRVGWLVAPPELVTRCMRSGLLDSGGGVSHFAAHVVAAYLELGLLDRHIAQLRTAYRSRRDALMAALAQYLPDHCRWQRPGGGFFAWVQLPAGFDSAALLPDAEAAGVSYVPGSRFFVTGDGVQSLRLAFSLLPVEALEEGIRRLGCLLNQ
ncbi:MAG: PLP-dependent aminotransferase family protein [Anaerolineae bacterium]|nr:PLP-dependent aminotransferase family protein [Anaerolineae bacterium]